MPRTRLSGLLLALSFVLCAHASAQGSVSPAPVDWNVTGSTDETVVAPDLKVPSPPGPGDPPPTYYTVDEYKAAFNAAVAPPGSGTQFSGSGFDGWMVVQRIPDGTVGDSEVIAQYPSPGTVITDGEFMHLLITDVGDPDAPTSYLMPLMAVTAILIFFVFFAFVRIRSLREQLTEAQRTVRKKDDE